MGMLEQPGVKENLDVAIRLLIEMYNDEEDEDVILIDTAEYGTEYIQAVVKNMELLTYINGKLADEGLALCLDADNEKILILASLDFIEGSVDKGTTISQEDFKKIVEACGGDENEARNVIMEQHKNRDMKLN